MNNCKGTEIYEAWVRINSKSFSAAIYTIYTKRHWSDVENYKANI